jgi:flagellar hook-basal body complex protein FliE
MVVNVADVLSAYRQGGGLKNTTGTGSSAGAEGASFSDTLKSYIGDAVSALETGEKSAAAAATGKANMANVIIDITRAEDMLQTIATIRDKVIAAYQDISKTAI